MFMAACIQLNSTMDSQRNLDQVETLCRRAASYGASLVATPENTPLLGPLEQKPALAQTTDGPWVRRMARLASELGIHLLLGSMPERAADAGAGRCFNTSVLLGPDGQVLATYRKLHLFDVAVPGGITIRESEHIAPGQQVVAVSTALGTIGLSICYDLRFPELYNALAMKGAHLVTVPAAFTLETGKDHWHVLLRARAVENQCWIMAPAQWGHHEVGDYRHSYGHALIVDPWGTVVAECSDGDGLCLAEIDLEHCARVRAGIPVREHRRLRVLADTR